MALEFSFYSKENENEWDKFVLTKSMNGIFIQTRKFINYHKDGKFKDCSILVRKGNELVAVVLACKIIDEGEKVFFSHRGTTFGGIIVSKNVYSTSYVDEIFKSLVEFLRDNGFEKAYFKTIPDIYQKQNTDLLDYFFYKYDSKIFNELNYYIDIQNFSNGEDILLNFTSNKRRDYRYSLKNNLRFEKLVTKEQIKEYYGVLLANLKKLGLNPVHSLEDLFDLKFNRFENEIEFYGVYADDKMIAGSMLFYFNDDIVHTQYLSSDENYLTYFPMDFLIYNLINVAVSRKKKIFSFGICTEDQGRYLNFGLSRFKEGFGTKFCINKSYEIKLKEEK